MPLVTSAPTRNRTFFTVRGSDPVTVEIRGQLDEGAAVGFRAVADWLVGDHAVTFDLRSCPNIHPAGEQAVAEAARAITLAGGTVTVHSWPSR